MNVDTQAEELERKVRSALRVALYDRIRLFGLLVCLALFTTCTLDGGDVAPFCISAATLALTAFSLVAPTAFVWKASFPMLMLIGMTLYGVLQTLFFPQHIAYDGWTGVLFWFTAACLVLLGSQIASNAKVSRRFRLVFVWFGSAVCVLELLEQASHTQSYFWLIPSRFPAVFGTFAYWNNFAQFVELLLPVTLWVALGSRTPDIRYMLLAAAQVGAVAMSGSRAGATLIVCELLAVLGLLFWRRRNRRLLYAAFGTIALSALFVYSAGVSEVVHKLQAKDQLSVRRQINESSIAMIKERPLTGWGLNSYQSVYPMFARFDAGTYVNRAHNDWLQWTAEGGIPFAGLMLAVFIWSIRPALRSVWGLGVIAVCLHALVDYPFARFGVCGWYFALLGMLVVV